MLIDSHCHLDDFERSGELEQVLARAGEAGVEQMITVGTSMADWGMYAKMAARHPGVIHWTAGLHPTELDEGWRDHVATLASWFATDPCPVAVGEVGLDYFHLPKDPAKAAPLVARQHAAFAAQLEIALQLGCPVVVHSRNSFKDVVEMIDRSGVDWKKVVFHCFSEGPEQVRLLNERGGRASFTGTVTYKNALGVLQAALAQGPDMLMIESDCPWLAPEPHRGTRNEPARIVLTARKIADELGMPYEKLCSAASGNTKAFFDI